MGGDDWLEVAVLYDVRPRSSPDSDGNGTEDLRGMIEHPEHPASPPSPRPRRWRGPGSGRARPHGQSARMPAVTPSRGRPPSLG
jgi:hypothetical protein